MRAGMRTAAEALPDWRGHPREAWCSSDRDVYGNPLSPPRASCGTNRHGHRPDVLDGRNDAVSGLDGTDAFGGSGDDHIAGIQRIERRRELDQFGDAKNHMLRIGILAHFAVHGNTEVEILWIGNLIGGDQPWPENGVTLRGLSKAALFRATRRDI